MRLGADRARVRVPATSANLGPGFDTAGMALGLYDDVEVRALGASEVQVDVVGEGADDLPTGADHLVVRALHHALDHVGAPRTGVHLVCRNRIPHGRGLGSSAAAVVAGLLAARALVAEPEALDDDVVLRLATELEGHPDNAAPALLGGATLAWSEGQAVRATRIDVHPTVVPIAVVPPSRLSTSHARGVLPAEVAHGDAAWQAGRAALLVEALGRRPELLFDATGDRLHQQQRRSVMPESLALVDALRAHGVPAVVSGAGPTVLVFGRTAAGDERPVDHRVTDADRALDEVFGGAMGGWRILRLGLSDDGALWRRLP
ncbi:homoserine kinase [Cellulomonas taurus]|uniref:homoserine kinase n=1 Tax=Cellulomonas taurus TaxID=2729175 RepID=UPI00145F3DBC|nr:homoserine kinase [Cellulomonas taurus]